MDEKMDLTPELTLTPNEAPAAAAAAAAVPQAPAAPTLTLENEADAAAAAQKARDEAAVKLDESRLSESERKMVAEFADKIDIRDSNVVLQYGAAAQKNIAAFSENALGSVRTKDLGEVGEALASLVVQLKTFGEPERKGIAGFFQKKKTELVAMRASFDKAEVNVDKIVQILEAHQVTLMKDIAMLDQMYALNQKYYKELTMYILAGKKALEKARTGELERLRQKAAETGAQEDAQAYNDFANMCTRFEKKIHDLELTRMISIQMGPQTRLIQNNDALMLEKIQSSLVNTIPLWKSQMVLALGLEHSRQAGDQYDQRAAHPQRGYAEDGHRGDRPGGRAVGGGHPDPAAHQPAAYLHPGRGHEDPDRGGPEAPGGRGRAGPHRGRAQAEAAGTAGLSYPTFRHPAVKPKEIP